MDNATVEIGELEKSEMDKSDLPIAPSQPLPTTYLVDGLRGVSVFNGVARLNFVEAVQDPETMKPTGRHNVIIAMPLNVFQNTIRQLLEVVEDQASQD